MFSKPFIIRGCRNKGVPMIHAVHHYPRVCFALHYFGPEFDDPEHIALCNDQADMVILSPGVGTTERGREILYRLTCEKWAYCCLNSTGNEDSEGYNGDLTMRALAAQTVLRNQDKEIVSVGSPPNHGYVIDPRRIDVWPKIAAECLLDWLRQAPEGTWDGIFLDNGWRDCWPLNCTDLPDATKYEINGWWSIFMREAATVLRRKTTLPIIGNGHWMDFIGRSHMVGRMLENIPQSGSLKTDAFGPRHGEGFAFEPLREWDYDRRIVLETKRAAYLQRVMALSLLFGCWISPPCGSGKACHVSDSRTWYAKSPARFDGTRWMRDFENPELQQRRTVSGMFADNDFLVSTMI